MNFLVPQLQLMSPKPISRFLSVPVRILLGIATTVIFLEFLVLWQFMQPVSLVIGEPTHAPRPESERSGILKRF